MLREWLATKNGLRPDEPLFPISGQRARRQGTQDVQDDAARPGACQAAVDRGDADAEERKRREQSDFLEYCNADGLYADFHSIRHLFITNLERAGTSPKMAQTLARHSDIRLTLGVYTHVGVHDQTAAIWSLPAPPVVGGNTGACS